MPKAPDGASQLLSGRSAQLMPLHVLIGLVRIALTWLMGVTAILSPFEFYQRRVEREIVRQLCLIYMAGYSLDEYAVQQLRAMSPESKAILEEMSGSGRSIAWTAGHVLSILQAIDV